MQQLDITEDKISAKFPELREYVKSLNFDSGNASLNSRLGRLKMILHMGLQSGSRGILSIW